jgi:hypothetical protein
MDGVQLRALIASKTRASSAAKQRSGQAYARMLGLTPGPSGRDDLIDGSGVVNGYFIYFQCKLSQYPLGAKYADEFYAGLEKYEAQIGILLSGVGYKSRKNDGFLARLEGYPRIKNGVFRYHLLSLEDLYCESERFVIAMKDLPPLQDLRNNSVQEE